MTVSQEKSGDDRSDAGSQAADSDYDVDEEYDNDYAENYFDNGEGDDADDLGGGAGDEGGGGGMSVVCYKIHLLNVLVQGMIMTRRTNGISTGVVRHNCNFANMGLLSTISCSVNILVGYPRHTCTPFQLWDLAGASTSATCTRFWQV